MYIDKLGITNQQIFFTADFACFRISFSCDWSISLDCFFCKSELLFLILHMKISHAHVIDTKLYSYFKLTKMLDFDFLSTNY